MKAAKGKQVLVGCVALGGGSPLALIAGPCVIESRRACLDIAGRLAELAHADGIPLIFKASYDKANRTSVESFRGPGIEAGLDVLAAVKEKYGLPLLTDVHAEDEVKRAAQVVDMVQIPAFLCRQTDLLLEAGRSGCAVNIKKGQFMAPDDMTHSIRKLESAGCARVVLTERGACFGYHDLVADMRSLAILRTTGYPVVFDATHSVQRPGAGAGRSEGDRWLAPVLARAAVGAGCDGVFLEAFVAPEKALCDGANALRLRDVGALWRTLRAIDEAVRG